MMSSGLPASDSMNDTSGRSESSAGNRVGEPGGDSTAVMVEDPCETRWSQRAVSRWRVCL